MASRSAAARRWPPMVATAAAAILVFLVLPSPLRVPQSNPTASAEYAPVPGRSQASNSSNFGETNVPTSAGIGSGGTGEGVLPGLPLPPIQQFDPSNRECIFVDGVARQTEDPLSPPCVSFFKGDNGGNTFPGVTKDDITVIFYNDGEVEGDLNQPWKPSDETQGHQSSIEDSYIVRTVKAHLRYFQRRYQTYGRTIRLIGQKSASGPSTPCATRKSEAANAYNDHHPFAVVFLGDNGQCYFEEMAQKFNVPSFGLNFDVPRAQYQRFAPFIWSFFPDQETEAQWSASFICDKLYGRNAKFTRDPLLQGRERRFGFIHSVNSARGEQEEQLAALLRSELRSQCGLTFSANGPNYIDTMDGSAAAGVGSREAGGILSKYKQNNVTTIICYCIPVQSEVTVTTMHNTANGLNYHPEWYWDHASSMDRPIWQQTFASPEQQGIGVSYLWRSPALRQQYHYQAYLREEPGTAPNVRFNFSIYHLFLNLFQAIQAAGPDLRPETVERGMFTFTFTEQANPYIPTGGYGPYDGSAVGDYNFVDTAMGWWYDPTGTPPGGRRSEGCIRVMNEGVRYYWNQWPRGDGDLVKSGDPCTADTRKLTDPGSSAGV